MNFGGKAFLACWNATASGYETTFALDRSNDPKPLFSFAANWYGAAKIR